MLGISIHALRVEGDDTYAEASTGKPISIHALRVEGDFDLREPTAAPEIISIHALRVEGDGLIVPKRPVKLNFYPRPPGGGRPFSSVFSLSITPFLSTPSGWRATLMRRVDLFVYAHFYPRPPGGGRHRAVKSPPLSARKFLSTPSGWRATRRLCKLIAKHPISIHALRVEGDF